MTVWGRSPLGHLRGLRAIVFFIPLMTLLVLTMAGRRFNGAFIDPVSLGQLQPFMMPIFAGTAIIVFLIGTAVKPETALPMRYVAICVTYILAGMSFWAGVLYFLAGASPVWAAAGLVLAIATVRTISLGRLASDVSGSWS